MGRVEPPADQGSEPHRARAEAVLAADNLPGPLRWLADPTGPIQNAAAQAWVEAYASEMETAERVSHLQEKFNRTTRAFIRSDPSVTAEGTVGLLLALRQANELLTFWRAKRVAIEGRIPTE